jgi:anti-sigma B factor antagonist
MDRLTVNFDIKSVWEDATILVKVSGEVDLSTAPALAQELRHALQGDRRVVVDLEKVEFLDCAGLRVLLSAAALHDPARPRMSVTPGPRQVQKLYELTGADQVLNIVKPAESQPLRRLASVVSKAA